MVAARSAPAPPAFAQLDLPAGLRALRDVPAHHQTDAVMDLAGMQFVRAPLSNARRHYRCQRLAKAGPGKILLDQQPPVARAYPLRRRRADPPGNQHSALES